VSDLPRHVDDDLVARLAADLVAVQGHEDLPQKERDTALFLHDALGRAGVESELVEIAPDRFNVLARVRGERPGPRLMLNGHLDTVPGYGMLDAYQPRWDGERLIGRGAVDMKGALASMAGALVALQGGGRAFRGELLLAAVAGEEHGSAGTRHLAASGPRADFAIVGEPTMLRIAVAHKGSMWIEVAFEGRSAHGSTPELGVNAIQHASRFVTELDARLRPRLDARTHEQLGRATMNVGRIVGGDRPPMVAERCVVQLDRRWLPGEVHEGVLEEVRALLRDLEAELPELRWTVREMEGTGTFVHHPLECPADAPGLAALDAAVTAVTGTAAKRFGAQFWTDGALLAHDGDTPAVVCGPGDIAQAHSAHEYIERRQLEQATRVYLLAAATLLGAEA
jgi:succinyl-diaminopimelate desuccinylase